MEIVCKSDFEDLSVLNNISHFECLLKVVEKASEKERLFLEQIPNSNLGNLNPNPNLNLGFGISIPIKEQQRLPFDLNSSPFDLHLDHDDIAVSSTPSATHNHNHYHHRHRTHAKRRRTPIDAAALFPCLYPPPIKKLKVHLRPPIAIEFEVPERVKQRITELNGFDPRFVIDRKMTDTDMNTNQGRLAMPVLQCKINLDYVGVDETVKVIQPNDDHDICELNFTKWSDKTFVINGHWRDFLESNPNLRSGDVVRVWTFRLPPSPGNPAAPKYGFAIVKINNHQ